MKYQIFRWDLKSYYIDFPDISAVFLKFLDSRDSGK